MDRNFTIEKGLEIQRENLAFYKATLNTETYAKFERLVKKLNDERIKKHSTGYDVPRGTILSNLFANILKIDENDSLRWVY